MGFLKRILNKSGIEIKYLLRKRFRPHRISNKLLIAYLKDKGVAIGEGTIFFDPSSVIVDVQRPWLLEIGNYCKITHGVKILCHDYSRSVLMQKHKIILCECKKTIIGDNVFIGIDSIILMGSTIGNNTIIGAGSVVKGCYPDNVVIAGNPARVICSLDDFYLKRKNNQLNEAKDWVRTFYHKNKRLPHENEMSAFFYLFSPRSENELKRRGIWYYFNGVDYGAIMNSYANSEPLYKDYESFLADVDLND